MAEFSCQALANSYANDGALNGDVENAKTTFVARARGDGTDRDAVSATTFSGHLSSNDLVFSDFSRNGTTGTPISIRLYSKPCVDTTHTQFPD